MTDVRRVPAFAVEVRWLYQAAMAVFVVTVGIGILNGLDLVDFDRNTILTHVHAGTLGWITLGVFATTLWLFGERGGVDDGPPIRPLTWSAIVSVPLYVVAFFSGNFAARAVAGVLVLAVILAMVWWALAASRRARLSIPRLSVLAGLATLAIGAIVGVVIQIQYATGTTLLSADAVGAHAAAMAFSYLVIVAMGFVEWQLAGEGDRLTRAGVAQVAFLFVGGLVLSLGLLVGAAISAVGGINLLCELIAAAIFIGRMGRRALGVPWLRRGSERHFGLAAIFVVVDIVILAYLIYAVISGVYGTPGQAAGFTDIPVWLVFALDHAIFIGVMTNLLFGLIRVVTESAADRWRWADHVFFWGTNIGLVGFVAGLALESVGLKRAFSPLMGISILVGLIVLTLRMQAISDDGRATDATA